MKNWHTIADTLIWWAGIITAAGAIGGALIQIVRAARHVVRAFERLSDQVDAVTATVQTIEDLVERLLIVEQIGDMVITHAVRVAIWEIDGNGRCRCASRGLCQLAGASRDDLNGMGWTNFVAAEQRESVLDALRRAAAEQNDTRIPHVRISNALLGHQTMVTLIASPLRGRTTGLIILAIGE